MAQCKNAVNPLLTHWSNCSLALIYQWILLQKLQNRFHKEHSAEELIRLRHDLNSNLHHLTSDVWNSGHGLESNAIFKQFFYYKTNEVILEPVVL